MNLELSEEQQLLTNMVERFTADHYGFGKRAEYLSSGSAEDLICIMQPLGKAVAVEPMMSNIVLAGDLLERAGTPEQKDHWIPKIMAGQSNLALAHSEAQARFDLGFVTTHAQKKSDKFILNGQKTFVIGAGAADGFIISAVLEGQNSRL